jgi:hypothetical protein
MKKEAVIALMLLAAALLPACSVKRGIGYVNNALTVRDTYEKVKVELSLGGGAANDFSDAESKAGYYHSEENGSVNLAADLAIGVYYAFFSNDFIAVSAGLKYTDYLSYSYAYQYRYDQYTAFAQYEYYEYIRINYFNSGKASVIFPDLEISTPYNDNLKLVASLELVYLYWTNQGGYYESAFRQRLNNSGYSEPDDYEIYNKPGKVTSSRIGSSLFYLGTLSIGALYYF